MPQIWINWARHRFVTGNEAGARELLARAMKVLEQRKHLETVSKFAILEFKHGTVERGRTMFEGIVSSYPKRVDMWNMYLDQEISRGTCAQAVVVVSGSVSPAPCDTRRLLPCRRCGHRSAVVRARDVAQAFVQEDEVLLQEVPGLRARARLQADGAGGHGAGPRVRRVCVAKLGRRWCGMAVGEIHSTLKKEPVNDVATGCYCLAPPGPPGAPAAAGDIISLCTDPSTP